MEVPRLRAGNNLTLVEKVNLFNEVAEAHDLGYEAQVILRVVYQVPKMTLAFPFDKHLEECLGDDLAALRGLSELLGKSLIEIAGAIEIKLPGVDYATYIQSDEWKAKAEAAKERAGQRCQTCNARRSTTTLDTHHRTYERLGNEQDEDLIVLCRDCHTLFHENGRLAKHP